MYVIRPHYVIGVIMCVLVGFPISTTAGSIQQFETYCDIDSWLPHTVVVRRAVEPLKLQTLTAERDTGLVQAVRVRWAGSADAVEVVCEPDITSIHVAGNEMPDGSREAIILITVPRGLLSSVHVE